MTVKFDREDIVVMLSLAEYAAPFFKRDTFIRISGFTPPTHIIFNSMDDDKAVIQLTEAFEDETETLLEDNDEMTDDEWDATLREM